MDIFVLTDGVPGKQPSTTIGDRILAGYQALSSCLCLGFLSLLSAVSFRIAAEPEFLSGLKRDYPSAPWASLLAPKYAVFLGVTLLVIAIADMCWIVATWRGRRWALWLHLILSSPSAVLGVVFGSSHVATIASVVVVIYCVLRLSGQVDAKPVRKGTRRRRTARRAA